MNDERIRYLKWRPSLLMEWAKSGYAGGKYNLARSGIPSITDLSLLSGYPFTPDVFGHNEWGHEGLKETIAALYGAKPENVLIAQGASQCNFLIAGAVLADRGTAIVETPVYEPILRSVEVWADRVIRLPRRREALYQPDPDELRMLIDDKTRLIVLTNLHNPTHAALDEQRLREIVRIGQEAGVHVAIDEVFMPMLETDFRKHGFAAGAISTNSLGKCWGLDALRVGWSVGSKEIIHRAYRLNNLLGVNQPYLTEDLAWRILNTPAAVQYLIERRRKAEEGKQLFDHFLAGTSNVNCTPPAAGICGLVHLPKGTDDREFSERLLAEQDTVVFPGHYFECPGAIRVCFGGPADETAEGLKRLSGMARSLS